MALSTDRIVQELMPVLDAIRPMGDVRRASRVDRAIDNAGRVIQEPRPFVRVLSPDGAIWRLKVSNTGAVTAAKE